MARAPATSCADDVILPSRDWLKTKCNEIGKFVITGFRDSTPGEIEAITVAEVIDDKLLPAGEVQFGVSACGPTIRTIPIYLLPWPPLQSATACYKADQPHLASRE